jgi:hypothetical protein
MWMETLTYNFPVFTFFLHLRTHCNTINWYTCISHCSLSNNELKLFLTSVCNANKLKTLCPHNDIQLLHGKHVNLQAVIHWFTLTEIFYSNKNRNLSRYMIMLNVSCNITYCTYVNWGLLLKTTTCQGYAQVCSFNLKVHHITPHHLFSFCGSTQDYKIHMDMEIVIFA